MPLTSNPLDTAGNIPLILLACDGDNAPDYYHPYARVSFVQSTTRPCIASTSLVNVTTEAQARHFAVWLPTPTITGQATLRNMYIAWDIEVNVGAASHMRGPRFQVLAVSQPARPPTGETKFTNWTALAGSLGALVDTNVLNQNDDVPTGAGLTQLTNITTPSEAGLAPDSACYLQVTMPLRTQSATKLIFRLLGIGLDQW